MTRPRVLFCDHPTDPGDSLRRRLELGGVELISVEVAAEALILLEHQRFDAVLAERSLGGEQLLAAARAQADGPAVILLDTFGGVEDAVEAVRQGAFDYVARPAPDEQVAVALRRALEARALSLENRQLRADLHKRFELSTLLSREERMQRVFQTIEAVAPSCANLLLEGESGTGKTALARAVHSLSNRAQRPFIELNCGALPANLLESELFGHARGAFTGALRERSGKFEAADGGTLFLDEVACASSELQMKLLRVLECGRFERVGEEQTRQCDVRVIAASNRPLTLEVAAGRFREDLYYRIHVVSILLPPLRERPADVPLLAEHFLVRARERHKRVTAGFAPQALRALLAHAWPGNVRELEHVVERAVLLARGAQIQAEDLGLAPSEAAALAATDAELKPGDLEGGLVAALERHERQLVALALRETQGSRERAAALLGVHRSTLFQKLRKLGLS